MSIKTWNLNILTGVDNKDGTHSMISPFLVQRDWCTHWLQRDAAVWHFLPENRRWCSAPNVWLKTSLNMAVLSVHTMLFAAGSSGSGNVPCVYHHLCIGYISGRTKKVVGGDTEAPNATRLRRRVLHGVHNSSGGIPPSLRWFEHWATYPQCPR